MEDKKCLPSPISHIHTQTNKASNATMKVFTVSPFVFVVATATAFAPPSRQTMKTNLFSGGNMEKVDRTMRSVDDNLGYVATDPTAGDSPAVSRNKYDEVWVKQRARPRRNRKSAGVRAMVRENIVTPANFIYPLFIHDEDENSEILSMPGCYRHTGR